MSCRIQLYFVIFSVYYTGAERVAGGEEAMGIEA
jgi:hypothetical protein